jgi:hypothetical protein
MDTTQLSDGAKVVGSDGSGIGTVKEVREDHLLVSAGTILKHDLYIPISRVSTTDRDDLIAVDIPAGDVEGEGWRYPPNAGLEYEEPAYPEVPETTTIQAAGMSSGRLSAPEPQGALKDDGLIDQTEVPNEDLPAHDRSPDMDRDEGLNR